ncbi:MAG: NmrA family NAD(P)-binding protein [Rhizomicrobium sp.]
MKKTITVFGATGTAGSACVDELLLQGVFQPRVLVRKSGQEEKTSGLVQKAADEKQRLYDRWTSRGVEIREANATEQTDLIPALKGTDYLVSCVPYSATESQYPLIWAAKEAGVERFVPSEFGFIYEWEQFWPTDTSHRQMARQKAFIRRVIELAGLDWTIIPAGLWPEYYMLEPVCVHGDGKQKVSWSTGRDVGRIIPHVLAHPASRNAICPVAATAYLSWDEMLAARERFLGRRVERLYMDSATFRAAYAQNSSPLTEVLMGIGVAATECPEGMPLWANWNAMHLPDFRGMELDVLFRDVVEPFVAATMAGLAAAVGG